MGARSPEGVCRVVPKGAGSAARVQRKNKNKNKVKSGLKGRVLSLFLLNDKDYRDGVAGG